MVTNIDRDKLRLLLTAGIQLVDVLPAEDFAPEHLPGAINLPLERLDRQAAARLDRSRPVVVYCHDYQ